MSKIFNISVRVYASAYIRADSEEEALEIARGLKDDELTVDGAFDSGVISGDRFSADMPDISLSPVMTIVGNDDGLAEEVFDDEDEDEEEEEYIVNYYECPTCNNKWNNNGAAGETDDCHNCGEAGVKPYQTDE